MSRQLRKLLKQNRVLEDKIFYASKGPDWEEQLISPTDLSAALSCLSNAIIDNTLDNLGVLEMLNQQDRIAKRPLPAFEKNALQVVEILFNFLREYSAFSANNYHLLNSLQLSFTRLSLNDLSFLDNPKHTAVRFLDKILELSAYFEGDSGKLVKLLLQAIELLCDQVANREIVNRETFQKATLKLDEYLDSYHSTVKQNEKKILTQLEKESRKTQADYYTPRLIEAKFQGEETPIFLLNFFEQQLAPLLHKIIIDSGVQSKTCQQLLTDMDTITWSITCPHCDQTYKARFEADVSDSMKRLYQLFEDSQALTDYAKAFFSEAESIHSNKLQGLRVDYDVMISADIFGDEEFGQDNDQFWQDKPEASLFELDSLNEGAWYQLGDSDNTARCKLLLFNELTEQLVFVNQSGELVRRVAFDETDYLAKHLSQLPSEKNIDFREALKALVKELARRVDILKGEYLRFKEKLKLDAAREKQRQQEAQVAIREKLEQERRERVKQHQRALEQEAEKRAEARRLEELSAKQRFFIKETYQKLVPGAVVAYKTDEGKWKEASLTLISRTTQKHIFSDSRGNTLLEPDKQQLYDLIENQRLKLVKAVDNKADPIQSLVKQRRDKLKKIKF